MNPRLLALAVLLAAGPAAPVVAATSAAPAPTLALVGARVYPAPGVPAIPDAAIVVRDGRIAAVGPRAEFAVPEGAAVLDLGGRTVVAGFWNAHVHFVDLFAPRWANAGEQPAPQLEGLLAEVFLRYGTTSVVDLGSPIANTLALRDRVERGEVAGPRILTSGMLLFPPGGVPPAARAWAPPEIATPEQGVAAVAARLAEGADLIKIATAYWVPEGPPPTMPADAVRAIVAAAHRAGRLVAAHPETLAGVEAAVEGGVDVIAHTAEAGGPWPPELIAEMVRREIALVPTLYLYALGTVVKGGTPAEGEAYVEASGVLEQLGRFAAAGGRVLFGTDVGFYPQTDMTPEYALMARAGLGFPEILAALTTAPAAAFGRPDLGSVAPGQLADLVVLGGDPGADLAALTDVRCTLRSGRVVYSARAAECIAKPAGTPAPAAPLAVVGGTVWPSPDDPPIPDAVVLIAGGRIAAVGPREAVAVPPGARVIDAAGGVVTAGFCNAHVHLMDPVFAAGSPPAALTAGLGELLARWGFTAGWDLGSWTGLDLARRIAAGELAGPRLASVGFPIYLPGGVVGYPPAVAALLPVVATPDAGRAAARRALTAGADAIKLFTGYGMDGAMPEEIVRAIVEEAHAGGKLVFAHPQNAAGVAAAVAGGVDLLAHTVSSGRRLPPAQIEAMRAAGIALVPTLHLWEFEAAREGSDLVAMLDSALDELAAFHRAGGTVIFGTDAGYMADLDPTREYLLMARAGMDARAILAALTTAPARLFDHPGEGRLAPGAPADLVVLDRDPRADPTAFAAVRTVLLDGEVMWAE